VTGKGGRWRNEETGTKAIEGAVYSALTLFLQGLDVKHGLPEFREYAQEKYPELDEDLITMIEDLILREKEIAPALKPRTSHPVTPGEAQEIGRRGIEKKHPHFFED